MGRPSRADRGFVHLELMLMIGLVGIGAAISLSSFLKLLRHQLMSGGNWTALIVGVLLAVWGSAPVAIGVLSGLFGKSRPK